MSRVCILMSTYNGEKYIAEQLNSIIRQTDVNIHIMIRDDGSVDSTKNIIRNFLEKYPGTIELQEGINLGFANSFYELLKSAKNYDYYAFADQDDIWEECKVKRAISIIDFKEPGLYASNLRVVDSLENSSYLLFSEDRKDEVIYKMENYFYMYNPYGCTMIWNSSLQNELQKYVKPDEQTHDVWVNLIAHCVGKVFYDYNSYINYRLHGENACGVTPKSFVSRVKKYYGFYFKNRKSLNIALNCNMIVELFTHNNDFLIYDFAYYKKNIFNKIRAICDVLLLKINKYEKIKFVILITFNRF